MICPSCRNQVVDNADFCPYCGTNLKQIQTQSPTPNSTQIQQTVVEPVMPQNNTNMVSSIDSNNNNRNNKQKIIVALVVIVLVIGLFVGVPKVMKKYFSSQANNSDQTKDNAKPSDDSNTTSNNNIGNNNNSNNNNNKPADTSTPNYDKDGDFLMSIEDVFTLSSSGTVMTGRILRGNIHLNDEVQIIGLNNEIITTTVTSIEMFRKSLDYAEAGNNVGIMLWGIDADEVQRGQVLAKPNSIKAATKFEANVYMLTPEEYGRKNPIYTDHKPQFYFRTTDVTGTITLPDNIEKVMPGETANMTIELIDNIAMEIGTEFSIRENGKMIGKGTVTKVY